MATLTYVYADSTAVLGPLATYAEPHTYDLCAVHAGRLTVPRGWEVVRLTLPDAAPEHNSDDLLALADAVREAARPAPAPQPVSAVPGRLASGGRATGPTDTSPDRPGHPARRCGGRTGGSGHGRTPGGDALVGGVP